MALLSGKWLENVDQTHLVLSSGKLVQQTRFGACLFAALIYLGEKNKP